MMADYYFLITALPPLSIGGSLDLSFKDLKEILALNLTKKDLGKVKELLRPIDLYNLRAFFLQMPLDERGTVKAKELEEELLVQQELPSYVIDFLERYETTEERLRYFSSLFASMYREAADRYRGFLKHYFEIEREISLVLLGLRSKQWGKDLVRELQFEDPYDPLVLELLSQKDSQELVPPHGYEDLKALFISHVADPKSLNRAILEYRFEKIEEMEKPQEFGIDRVLAYVAKFLLVESIFLLDKEKGMEQLSQYE